MRTSLLSFYPTRTQFILKHPIVFLIVVLLLIPATFAIGQPATYKYRTFSQTAFAMKKDKAGKAFQSIVTFKFYNKTGSPANGIHAKFNSSVLMVTDSGGFTSVQISARGKVVTFGGKSIPDGDSVSVTIVSAKKAPGTIVSNWEWLADGFQVGPKNTGLTAIADQQVRIQPNGGNVLEFIYKKIVTRPQGVVVGMKTDTPGVGWIRYMKSDRGYFPHTGIARCFDGIMTGSGSVKAVKGELKNPKVKKHDNVFLGELHILKLAIIANDGGMTEPLDTNATLLGDLVYNDASNPSDICNGMTLRGIVALADSAFTYCSHFTGDIYSALLADIVRINTAFDGPYQAVSFDPFILAGTNDLGSVAFLHGGSVASPSSRIRNTFALTDDVPEMVSLKPNYPNPFNPTTSIEFSLPATSVVSLTVYNLLGQEVAQLLDRATLDEGDQTVDFNAGSLSSGIYFYRLLVENPETRQVKSYVNRMMLVR